MKTCTETIHNQAGRQEIYSLVGGKYCNMKFALSELQKDLRDRELSGTLELMFMKLKMLFERVEKVNIFVQSSYLAEEHPTWQSFQVQEVETLLEEQEKMEGLAEEFYVLQRMLRKQASIWKVKEDLDEMERIGAELREKLDYSVKNNGTSAEGVGYETLETVRFLIGEARERMKGVERLT